MAKQITSGEIMRLSSYKNKEIIYMGELVTNSYLQVLNNYGYGLDKRVLQEMMNNLVSISNPSENTIRELSLMLLEQIEDSDEKYLIESAIDRVIPNTCKNRSATSILPQVIELVTENNALILTSILLLAYKRPLSSLISRLEKLEVFINKTELKAKIEFEKIRSELQDDE